MGMKLIGYLLGIARIDGTNVQNSRDVFQSIEGGSDVPRGASNPLCDEMARLH